MEAQVCSGPGRTPQTAFPVCGTVVFNQPGVSNCTGSLYNNTECLSGISSSNSVWYSFTCYEDGLLSFLITPTSPTDDYDWILMDVTGRTGQQILSNDYSISLNYSGTIGTTGCTATGIGNFNCAGGPRYNQSKFIEVGRDYMLMVTNFSQSGNGYSISFSGSTANLSNDVDPFITNVSMVKCNSSQLEVSLSEYILCSSITASGSEFLVNNGSQVISGVVSECAQGNVAVNKLIINLQQPLTGGNYTLSVRTGTDGNSLQDVCLAPMAAVTIPFTVPPQQPLAVKTISYEGCSASILKLVLNRPVWCNSISNNGSEFVITPGTHPINTVSATCSNTTYTDTIRLVLQAPLGLGNYQLQIQNGSDGNTLADTCGPSIANGYSVPFSISPRPVPTLDSIKFDQCSPSRMELFYSTAIACNSISANGSDYFITGPSTVNIASATGSPACVNGFARRIVLTLAQPISTAGSYTLNIKNGTDGNTLLDSCSTPQSVMETISFNTFLKPNAAFNNTLRFGCDTDTLAVTHPGGGGINFWQWTFNNGAIVNGPSAVQYYPASDAEAAVRLIVSNGNCADTLSTIYPLDNAFKVKFTLADDSLCMNKAVQINNLSTGKNLTFLWDYGDGFTYTGAVPPPYKYTNTGTYTLGVRVSNNYGCVIDSFKTVHIVDTPLYNFTGLLNRYCTGDTVALQAQISGARVTGYTWNNDDGVILKDIASAKFVYKTQGQYKISLTITDSFCGDMELIKIAPVFLSPTINLGPDLSLCPDIKRNIGVQPTAGYQYAWNTGALTPGISIGPVSSRYILNALSNGCTTADSILVTIMDTCLLRVPNAFTPNNDGINDRLKVVNAELATNFNFRVYDRYGKLVYASTNPSQGWDGTIKGVNADAGTYVWQVSYVNPYSRAAVFDKGTSILIR